MRSRGRRRRQEPRLPAYAVTVQQAAEFINLSQPEIRRLVREGRLPAARVGRRILLRVQDLKRFVDSLISQPEPDPLEGLEPAGRREGGR